jgi:hypothetical protein
VGKDVKRATGGELAAAFDRVDKAELARKAAERAKRDQQKQKGK